jgi:hypothetical protein
MATREKLRHLEYTVRINKSKHYDAEKWCRENFGERWCVLSNRTGIWCCFWGGFREANGNYRYHFANERDAVLFALRWA